MKEEEEAVRQDNPVSKIRSHIVCWSEHTVGEGRNRFKDSNDDNDDESEDKIITFDSVFFIITWVFVRRKKKKTTVQRLSEPTFKV